MYAIEAIYDGTNFKPMQPILVKEKYKVVFYTTRRSIGLTSRLIISYINRGFVIGR